MWLTQSSWAQTVDSSDCVYFAGHDKAPGPLSDVFLMKVDPKTGAHVWNAI